MLDQSAQECIASNKCVPKACAILRLIIHDLKGKRKTWKHKTAADLLFDVTGSSGLDNAPMSLTPHCLGPLSVSDEFFVVFALHALREDDSSLVRQRRRKDAEHRTPKRQRSF